MNATGRRNSRGSGLLGRPMPLYLLWLLFPVVPAAAAPPPGQPVDRSLSQEEVKVDMQKLQARFETLRTRIDGRMSQPLYLRRQLDLQLRLWAIQENLANPGKPDAKVSVPHLIEIGEAELEALLDDLDRGEDRLAQQQGMVLRALSVSGQDHPQPYAVHVPKGYDAGRPWPLFIYLHGGGGQVNQARYALERLAQASASSQPAAPPAFAPPSMIEQMLKIWLPRRGGNWAESINEDSVLAAIEDVKRNYNVDADRIYVQGFSLGGFATMHYATRFPGLFAGAAPSGMTWDYDLLPLAENLAHLPVFLCHGSRDDTCPVENSARLFEKLKSLSFDAIFQEEVQVRHQTTNLARAAQEAWLLTKTRNPWPDKVTYVTDNPRYHRAYWIDILQLAALSEESRARIEAVRDSPGHFTIHTQGIVSFAILLAEAIAPPSQSVTVSINDQAPKTYPWPADGRLVLALPVGPKPR
jgi:predicted esterase